MHQTATEVSGRDLTWGPQATAPPWSSPSGDGCVPSARATCSGSFAGNHVQHLSSDGGCERPWGGGLGVGALQHETRDSGCVTGIGGSGASQLEAARRAGIDSMGRVHIADEGDCRAPDQLGGDHHRGSVGLHHRSPIRALSAAFGMVPDRALPCRVCDAAARDRPVHVQWSGFRSRFVLSRHLKCAGCWAGPKPEPQVWRLEGEP